MSPNQLFDNYMAKITFVKDRIIKLLYRNFSVNKISKIIGCSKATIIYHKKKNGFKVKKRVNYNFLDIQKYYDAGHTIRETRKYFGIRDKALQKARKLGKFKTRNLSEANILSNKLKPRTHTKTTKIKLRKIRKKFLKENPEKHPQRILANRKEKWTYPEKRFSDRIEQLGFIYDTDFTHNKKVLEYYPDFIFEDKNLIVEIDGEWFHRNKKKDKIRQRKLEKLGYKVIRFSASDINKNLDICIDKFLKIITYIGR